MSIAEIAHVVSQKGIARTSFAVKDVTSAAGTSSTTTADLLNKWTDRGWLEQKMSGNAHLYTVTEGGLGVISRLSAS